MALVSCHECGKSVSTEAKTCPACGATVKRPKKPTSKFVWALLGVMGIGVAVSMSQQQASEVAAKQAQAAMTPEQAAQAKAKKDKESQAISMAAIGAKTLKGNSKDPQSFEFTSIVLQPNNSVCYGYRAKNSFNAMLAGDAVLANGKMLVRESAGNAFVTAWNKNCTPAGGKDVMTIVGIVLKKSL